MTITFNPDGSGEVNYCARCEYHLLAKHAETIKGLPTIPGLHRECKTAVKVELVGKMSATWKRYTAAIYRPIGSPLANVVKAATGIDL